MFEQDYLMRIFLQLAEIIRRSWTRAGKEHDPQGAADMLEDAIGDAADMDADVLLTLSPDSVAGILQVSGTDPRVAERIARSLLLASGYRTQAGQGELAEVRLGQARAVAAAFGVDLPESAQDMASLLDDALNGADVPASGPADPALELLGFGTEPLDCRTGHADSGELGQADGLEGEGLR